MGFDPRTIGYLWYRCRQRGLAREQIAVRGEDAVQCVTRYQPSESLPEILGWYVPEWQSYVNGSYLKSPPA